jgi:Phosphoglycerate dehydrogenase and related dehydrogenases
MDEEHRDRLKAAAPQTNFIFADKDDTPDVQTLESLDIIVGNPRRRLLSSAKNLKWLQLESAGANLYVIPGLLPESCVLTNATGCFGLAISEYMIGMVLSIFQHLPKYGENQKKHLWNNEGQIKSIYGSTALVIGLGNIGGEFAMRYRALGGKVIGMRRSNLAKPEYVDELYLMDKLDEVLPRADVVALSLPETPQTKKLFGKEKLALMKPGAVLLNVGRGSAVDSDALCEALNSGHLGGAALDVTDPEPLPAEHPLWNAKNALITPHISGGYNLPETYERVFRVCADNLRRYVSGEPLQNVVDFNTGYKKTDFAERG